MTLVLAAKYSDGVMYCSDVAKYNEDNTYISINKVLQAPNTPIVRAITGVLPSINGENFLLEDISKYYASKYSFTKKNSKKSVLKTLNKYDINSWYFMYNFTIRGFRPNSVKECCNEYVFSWPEKNDFALLQNNSLFMNSKFQSCVAIGSGSYVSVREFLNNNYRSNMDENSVKSLLKNTFDIALIEDKKAFDLDNSRYLLHGRSLAKHTINGLEQILFEEA
ncbi:MAG: hypothetical protein ACP5N1_02055 [Candidatus Woesearchaeota archaeon]